MSLTISNDENILDSRDVNAHIEALKEAQQDIEEELKTLEHLVKQASLYAPDWEHGTTLIRDSYFEEYAQDFAEEIGAISETYTWPASYIDWGKAVRELQMNYTRVEFDGVMYWMK